MPVYLAGAIEGDVQLARSLGVKAGKLKDFSVPLQNSGDLLLKTFDQNFDARGALMGGWQPRSKVYSHPLLEKTGRMRHGFFKRMIGSMVLVLGNRAPYFPYHQSNKARKRLPRRVMMKIIEYDKRAIVKEFQKSMQDILKARS